VPAISECFNSSWYSIGLKCSTKRTLITRKLGGLYGDLSATIAEITHISYTVLRGVVDIEALSVAEKIS
jgi:hypothetical protein